MLELLSPAGSPEAVVAAVQCGADAVYLGLGGFNARRGAANFSEEEFLQAAAYCRERGCKLYVTLNTLVSDREMPEFRRLACLVNDAGADAALVQDLGAAAVLRQVCPELPLHASTQMSVHNLAGVHAAAQMGFRRVVLARELSLEEIAFIAGNSPIETEVFVHGALCVCHSGQCYMSALIGRRSGNRGMCAQPCRMAYNMGRRADGFPLSLKDCCLVEHLQELDSAGVKCVKIEGRMKRPEYTALTTQVYAKAIKERIKPSPVEMERLTQIFSRGGFTDGYFTDKREDMHGVREEEKPEDIRRLYADIRKSYNGVETRRVGVHFAMAVNRGGSRLMASDEVGHSVTVDGPAPDTAHYLPLTEEDLRERLYKTGGTPYHCEEVNCDLVPGMYLTASEINDMRRRALEGLSEQRRAMVPHFHRELPPLPGPFPAPPRPVLTMQVLRPEQLTEELAWCSPAVIYIPLTVLHEQFRLAAPFLESGAEVCAVLPRVIFDDQAQQVADMLQELSGLGIHSALVGNLGHVALARRYGMAVRGDFGLNAFNSYTLEVLRQAGLESATCSFELRLSQVRDLAKSLPAELIIYGRLPCMITEQDLIAQAAGNRQAVNASLSDRKGSVFPVVRDFGGRNVIYNAHKLFLADRSEDFSSVGLWAGRLLFTTESPRECVEIARRYVGRSAYEPNGLTRGLYYRGVE